MPHHGVALGKLSLIQFIVAGVLLHLVAAVVKSRGLDGVHALPITASIKAVQDVLRLIYREADLLHGGLTRAENRQKQEYDEGASHW